MQVIGMKLLREKIAAMQEGEPKYAYNFLNDAQNPSTEWGCVEDMIDSIPVIEAEPVRHGRWIRGVSKGFPKNPTCLWYCSCCGEKIRYYDTLRTYQKLKKPVNEVNPRCRKCGAKMDGGESQDNDSHIKL